MTKAKEWNGPPPPPAGRGVRSPYPFKNWPDGETKRYPAEDYKKIRNAVQNLNRAKDGHWRYGKVLENGKIWTRVWRDDD